MTSRPSAFAIAVAVAESMPPERRTTAVGPLIRNGYAATAKGLASRRRGALALTRRVWRRSVRTDRPEEPPVDSRPSLSSAPPRTRSHGLPGHADTRLDRTADSPGGQGTPLPAAEDPRTPPEGRPRRTPRTPRGPGVLRRADSGGLRAGRCRHRSGSRGLRPGGAGDQADPGRTISLDSDPRSRGRFPPGRVRTCGPRV